MTSANSYTGSTNINAGTLQLGNATAILTGSAITVNGGTFDLNGFSPTYTSTLAVRAGTAGASTLSIGTSTLTLNNATALSMTGGTINGSGAGNLKLGGNVSATVSYGTPSTGLIGGTATISANVDLNAATRTFTVDNGANVVDMLVSGNISDSSNGAAVGFTKAGAGTVRLTGTNTWLGSTTISSGGGVLEVGGGNAIPDTSAVTSGTAAVFLDLRDSNETIGSLASSTVGTINLGNGFDRGVLLGTGRLTTGADGTATTYSGSILGTTGGVTKTGAGNWTVTTVAGTQATSWYYNGLTDVSAGTLALGASNILPNQSRLNVGGSGTFAMAAQSDGVGSLTGTGVITTTGTLSVGFDNTTDASFSGTISGTGGKFTKEGTGTQTLGSGGTFTYDGATAVNGGTLVAANAAALGTTTAGTTVASGATLDVQASLAPETISVEGAGVGGLGALVASAGTGTVAGLVTLTGNASIGGAGTLNVSGGIVGAFTVTKVGAGTLNFAVGSTLTTLQDLVANNGTTNVNSALGTGGNATVSVTGTTTLKFGSVSQTLSSLSIGAGATVTFTSGLASFSGGSGGGKTPSVGGGSTVVPEPGTLGLLLVGALGLLNRRRRQA